MSFATRLSAVFAAGLAVLMLAGCAGAPPRQQFADLTYKHLEPIRIDVARIEVRQTYEPPLAAPYVEHEMPVSPAQAARQWAEDRLQAVGDAGTLTYTIRTASVREEDLETESGISGLFTSEPSQRYLAKLVIDIRVERPGDSGKLTATAERTTTVQEDASVNDREKAWYGLVEKLMQDLDGQLETTLRADFDRYVTG